MRLSRFMALTSTLLAGSACGELYQPAPAEFETLCGEPGPIQLANFELGQAYSLDIERFGERYVALVWRRDVEGSQHAEMWSMGFCGEEPRVLVEEVHTRLGLRRFDPWPDLPFVCTQDAELLAVDPTGERPPRESFQARGCRVLETTAGLVYVGGKAESGPLILQPWPDDPLGEEAEEIVLNDSVLGSSAELLYPSPRREWRTYLPGPMAAGETALFALNDEHELIAISLSSLESELIASEVRDFQVDAEGRRIVWAELSEDPDIYGPVYLRDRTLDEAQLLRAEGAAGGLWSVFTLEDHDLVQVCGFWDIDGDCWRRLSTLEAVQIRELLPGLRYGFTEITTIDDERAIFSSSSGLDAQVANFTTGEVSTLLDVNPQVPYAYKTVYINEHLLLYLNDALLRISLEGEFQAIAPDPPTSWAVARDWRVFGGGYGGVIVVDPDTHEERLIDDVGDRPFVRLIQPEDEPETVLVAYIVDEPGRSGLWLARPKP